MDSKDVIVSIVGTGISTTADKTGQFTLTNVPTGTVQLAISGGGTNATVTISGIGPNDRVQINVTVSGSSARVDSEHHSAPDNKGEFQGRITSIDLTGSSFKVLGTTIKVVPATVIRHGNQSMKLADLKVGNQVEVRGTKIGDVLTAAEIKVEQGDSEDDNRNSGEVELKGAVTGFTPACPTASFTLQGLKVGATAATTYERGTCDSLKNTVVVQVAGKKNADGTVTATKISFESAQSNAVDFKGTLSGLSATTACPVVTFTVQSTKIATSTTTVFDRVTCLTLKEAMRVEVRGTKLADGSVAATTVSLDN
jgi:hypothetical protein